MLPIPPEGKIPAFFCASIALIFSLAMFCASLRRAFGECQKRDQREEKRSKRREEIEEKRSERRDEREEIEEKRRDRREEMKQKR